MTGHTDEIVKAAEAVARCYERGTKNYFDTTLKSYFDATLYEIALRDLARAVAAKREAEKPKRMTVEEAELVYTAKAGITTHGWTFHSRMGVKAIIDAAHRKAFEVIKAKTPMHAPVLRGNMVECRSLDDISHALGITEERHG